MPNRNGQGPTGAGSMTGRRQGLCNGGNQAVQTNFRQAPVQVPDQQQNTQPSGCRGPRGCGSGAGRRSGCGCGRGQR